MKIEQIAAVAQRELEALKSHATEEEIGKLDRTHFDPNAPDQCIYGQMTGCCKSKRAKALMRDVDARFFVGRDLRPLGHTRATWMGYTALEQSIMNDYELGLQALGFLKGDQELPSLREFQSGLETRRAIDE